MPWLTNERYVQEIRRVRALSDEDLLEEVFINARIAPEDGTIANIEPPATAYELCARIYCGSFSYPAHNTNT